MTKKVFYQWPLLRLMIVVVTLMLLAAGAASVAATDGQLDGGGFPTPTPTATFVPTDTPFPTATTVPLELLFPTDTPVPQAFDRQAAGADIAQSQEAGPSSPNLFLLALPFLAAAALLGFILFNILRRNN
jgi:hypothetical protein